MRNTFAGFRYSLRALFIIVAAVACGCAWLRWHLDYQRDITQAGGTSCLNHSGPSNLTKRVYRDRQGRLVAILVDAYDDLDPNGRKYGIVEQSARGYSIIVTVNGERLGGAQGPVVFVNGPYGQATKVPLSDDKVDELASINSIALSKFYSTEIDPQLYRAEGKTVSGVREGKWTFKLPSGELYKKVEYLGGIREGECRFYYRTGQLKAVQRYGKGYPIGVWEFWAKDGHLLAALDRGNDSRGGGSATSSRTIWAERSQNAPETKDRPIAKAWACILPNDGAYKILIDNKELELEE